MVTGETSDGWIPIRKRHEPAKSVRRRTPQDGRGAGSDGLNPAKKGRGPRARVARGSARKSIPYARQTIEKDDIAAVVEVLRSDWLTTGPKVPAFEKAVAPFTGAPYAVAVSHRTAALHGAIIAAGIGSGDEALVPANNFAASANAGGFQ